MVKTIIAEVPETESIQHKPLVPPKFPRRIKFTPGQNIILLQTIAVLTLEDGSEYELKLAQKWPIRIPRPTSKRYPASKPLVTGQRILDTLFPIAKGGTAAVPGGFGMVVKP